MTTAVAILNSGPNTVVVVAGDKVLETIKEGEFKIVNVHITRSITIKEIRTND